MAGWMLGVIMNDVVITPEEITGLMDNLLFVDAPATGKKKFSEWTRHNKDTLGVKYASELARRRSKTESYKKL